MKSYLKPSISGVQSDVLLAKLQGTGGLGINCTEDAVLCDHTLDIKCTGGGVTTAEWAIVFFSENNPLSSNCRIEVGLNSLSNCSVEEGPSCGEGHLYRIACEAASCYTVLGTPIYISCGDETATCRQGL